MFGQDFGHRLRELRLAQGLTKEKFCEGDEVLSVRQLTRIETGKSQPKLETLEHLARRLNISLSELLGERAIGSKLPVEYLNLKYQLMHATSLDKPNNLMKLDEKLGKIIDSYYDDLPAMMICQLMNRGLLISYSQNFTLILQRHIKNLA